MNEFRIKVWFGRSVSPKGPRPEYDTVYRILARTATPAFREAIRLAAKQERASAWAGEQSPRPIIRAALVLRGQHPEEVN